MSLAWAWCSSFRPAHASCLLVNRWAWSSCLSLKEKLTAFIKTTYDISLDSQISFLPSGFCPGIACFSLSSSLSFSPQHAIVRKPGTWKQESIHLIVIFSVKASRMDSARDSRLTLVSLMNSPMKKITKGRRVHP